MQIKPQDWETVKVLFEAALERPSEERAVFLDKNCPSEELRNEVEALLAGYEEAGSFLDVSAVGPWPAAPVAFSVGDVLAGRFQIVRFIAAGGMGEVYEANDLELHEPVAIKAIRPEILSQPKSIARFKREVHLARKVTHPNACRIFDLFRHRTATGEEVIFVSMELLHGKTLGARIKEQGRLSPTEALPLVGQMTSALAAAHAAGVVHRDFKPGNVVLVPAGTGMRAVVTDFGLALDSLSTPDGASLTSMQGILGTPAYMSPEQLEGKAVTPASDIYALGLVIYEMVTGTRAFMGDSPLAAALKRLEEAPVSPRTHVPDLDRDWEEAILRCLERNPENRFVSAIDVAKALTGEIRTPVTKRYRLPLALATAVFFLLLVSLGGYLLHFRRESKKPSNISGPPIKPIKVRRSIAVLGFKNLSGHPEVEWLSTAFSEMLSTELAAGEQLRTIPGENVARTKIELSLPDADSFAKDTLGRIRNNLNTDYVVLGSYFDSGKESGGQVRLDLRLQDATAGETITSVSETGTEAQLLDLVSRTGAMLRERLGVEAVTPAEAANVRAALPFSPKAARFYADGLKKLRLFDAVGARKLLEKAVAAEPNYPMAHSALAAVWQRLGYEAKAKQEAKKALDLSVNLSREERLVVEARYRETTNEWDRAVELYRALLNLYPDNLDYGVRLCTAQWQAGKGKDALETVEALRKLPPPSRDDPLIDLAEDRAAGSLGDFKRQQQAAARAQQKAEAIGAPLLTADAQGDQCSALMNEGQYTEAGEACENAKRIYARSGDRQGVAATLGDLAGVLYGQGNLAGAYSTLNESLAVVRTVGDRYNTAADLANISTLLSDRGDHVGAQRGFEQALVIFREIDSKSNVGIVLGNIGQELMFRGQLTGADTNLRRSLAVAREIGSKDDEAQTLYRLAYVLSLQGELGKSKKLLDQSLEICHRIGSKQMSGDVLSILGTVLKWQGSLGLGKARYEEALAISSEIGAQLEAAEDRVSLAELSIDVGDPAVAEGPVREAIKVFQKQKLREQEIWAATVLARALLAQGKLTEARKQVDMTTHLFPENQNEELSLKFDLVDASIRGASDNSADRITATKALETTLAKATKHGYIPYAFEARLALGEIEMKSGRNAAGRTRLAALERDADAKGFKLIARKASKAQNISGNIHL